MRLRERLSLRYWPRRASCSPASAGRSRFRNCTDRNLKVGGDGVEHVKIWGRESGVTAEVTVRYEPELPGRRFFCSMYSPNYNKLYFDFCFPHDVKKGEKWKTRTTYILDIIR